MGGGKQVRERVRKGGGAKSDSGPGTERKGGEGEKFRMDESRSGGTSGAGWMEIKG